MAEAKVITRIAPSPTGNMHIGTARTAYFNWLYARRKGGRFLLRIEDTDRHRSSPEASRAITRAMSWLGLDWDGDAVSQFSRADRHAQVARELLERGKAFRCFSTPDEIETFRERARLQGHSTLFRSPWRDADPTTLPDAPFAIRIKAPKDGVTVIHDRVQGNVTVRNSELDDMVCLRSDGTPTYMLAVVVDDHDMGITHVIRGGDHLTNAARQMVIYDAMDWDIPVWAHIPLIHGPDGKKLSKRHGALGVEEYEAMGFPAAAMRNYLARLGWSHGDSEFFTDAQAVEWFDLDRIGKSPARFDLRKLEHLSSRHIAATDDADLLAEIERFLDTAGKPKLDSRQRSGLLRALSCLKGRARTLPDLLEKAHFILSERPFSSGTPDPETNGILMDLTPRLRDASWEREILDRVVAEVAEVRGVKSGEVLRPLRTALAGSGVSPSALDMMSVIGRDETLFRLCDATGHQMKA